MKSKSDKAKELELNKQKIKSSQTILFADYGKVGSQKIEVLKKELRSLESDYKVTKKRILKIAFEQEGLKCDPENFDGQLAIIYSPKNLIDIAAPISKFAKTNEPFKIIGGFDCETKEPLALEYIQAISSLPSKEVLLGNVVGMFAAPLKMFMLVLKERAKSI